jgi:hypothetical protein
MQTQIKNIIKEIGGNKIECMGKEISGNMPKRIIFNTMIKW